MYLAFVIRFQTNRDNFKITKGGPGFSLLRLSQNFIFSPASHAGEAGLFLFSEKAFYCKKDNRHQKRRQQIHRFKRFDLEN